MKKNPIQLNLSNDYCSGEDIKISNAIVQINIADSCNVEICRDEQAVQNFDVFGNGYSLEPHKTLPKNKGLTGCKIASALKKAKLLEVFSHSQGKKVRAMQIEDVAFLKKDSSLAADYSFFFVSTNPKLTIDEIENAYNVKISGYQKYLYIVKDIRKAKKIIKGLFQ